MKVDLYQLAKDNNILNNATIELLTRCNWRCQHCYIPEHNNSGLSTNEWFNILHQLRAIGCFDILFTGGEPFYRDDII
ncbi:hypothetical protein KQI89_15690 [Clostridium sp. MSJ-4]|uniref:Radical SAM core domain-containing protein n=1 Tax=Clostridium simiarum TaxID=2841506 RepID=A0ABS6F3U2_9CLOT|nr:radical SAM protein [Clostridium simiarum]MBU5593191.1 hypothetical protein [Clostridium simiarum]